MPAFNTRERLLAGDMRMLRDVRFMESPMER